MNNPDDWFSEKSGEVVLKRRVVPEKQNMTRFPAHSYSYVRNADLSLHYRRDDSQDWHSLITSVHLQIDLTEQKATAQSIEVEKKRLERLVPHLEAIVAIMREPPGKGGGR